MRQITLQEFLEGYEAGLITEVVCIDSQKRIYGRSVKGMVDRSEPYEIVWAQLP